MRILIGTILVCLIALAGCGGGDEQNQQQGTGGSAADAPSHAEHPGSHGDHPAAAGGATVLAGVTFDPPAAWRDLGPSGMRKAQYRLAPVESDSADGELNVFYFGPADGGGVEANIQRWIGQVTSPTSEPQRGTFTADGMAGHIVTVDGSYQSGGGRPMGGDGELLPGYRLVGVVLEGPEGSLFFKLTGPEATVRAMEGDLLAMVKAARQ